MVSPPPLPSSAGPGQRAPGAGALLRPEPGPVRVGPRPEGHLAGPRHRPGGDGRPQHPDRPHLQPEGLAAAVHGAQEIPRAALHRGTGF